MASNSVLFVALLLIATTSLGSSQITVTLVQVSGRLVCSLDPPSDSSPPCPDVTVYLSLDGSDNYVTTAVTGQGGYFTISYQTQGITLDPAKVEVFAASPVGTCAVFARVGVNIYAQIDPVVYNGATALINTGAFGYRN